MTEENDDDFAPILIANSRKVLPSHFSRCTLWDLAGRPRRSRCRVDGPVVLGIDKSPYKICSIFFRLACCCLCAQFGQKRKLVVPGAKHRSTSSSRQYWKLFVEGFKSFTEFLLHYDLANCIDLHASCLKTLVQFMLAGLPPSMID